MGSQMLPLVVIAFSESQEKCSVLSENMLHLHEAKLAHPLGPGRKVRKLVEPWEREWAIYS